jgi:hypothetical protein
VYSSQSLLSYTREIGELLVVTIASMPDGFSTSCLEVSDNEIRFQASSGSEFYFIALPVAVVSNSLVRAKYSKKKRQLTVTMRIK